MSQEYTPRPRRPLNWRISDFCEAFGMGRTKFSSLVKSEEIRIVKFGGTSLIPDAEARRLQAALEAGEL